MKNMRFAALSVASLFALAACGGSSSSTLPGAGSVPAARPAAPAVVAVPDNKHKKKHKLVPVHFTISFPHPKKHGKRAKNRGKNPHYISTSSTEITIQLNSVNSNPPPSGLLLSVTTPLTVGDNCTVSGGTETCAVSGPSVPVGSDSMTFTADDGATTLSTVTATFNVVAGASNSFTASLQGVAQDVSFLTVPLTAGTPVSDQGVIVTARDPDGNGIVGSTNYANPITVSSLEYESDPYAAVTLSVNGGTPDVTATLNSPADVLRLNYTGLSITPFALQPTGTGITVANSDIGVTTYAPVAVCADSGAGVCASGPQVNLYDASPNVGSTANLTVTQTGWTASTWLRDISETDNCGASGVDIATVALTASTSPGGGGTVFSVTTLDTPSAGASCSITLKGGDLLNQSITVPVTYTVSGISVNGRHHSVRTKP